MVTERICRIAKENHLKVNQCRNAYIFAAHPSAGHFEVILAVALRMKQILSAGLQQSTHRLLGLKHQVHVTYNKQVCHHTDMELASNQEGKEIMQSTTSDNKKIGGRRGTPNT